MSKSVTGTKIYIFFSPSEMIMTMKGVKLRPWCLEVHTETYVN